jgi:predicted acyl esterase
LGTAAPTDEVTAVYDIGSNPDAVSFVTRFDEETALVGYPKAHRWVEAEGADDMDLFVLVQKLDAYGTPLQQFTVPNQGAVVQDLTERGASILRYKGSDGRLRVSLRRLDETLSTDAVPAHSFDRIEKLAPGEVADVEIDLLPIGLAFHPGEQLRLVISGRHIVHTGGEHASYLQLPVQTR